MAWPAVGVVGAVGLRRIAANHGRQEHEARPALVWSAGARRPEVEEALRPLDGVATRPQTVKSLCLSVIPGSVC